MIICITPNPAIDRTLVLPGLIPGTVQRAEQVIVAAGGKGLNVARAIRTLGGDSLSMGFAGGYAGRLLSDLARGAGLKFAWTRTTSETRTCIILASRDGRATVINEPGAPVSKSDWKRLQRDVRKHLSAASRVCVSGSLPTDSSADDLRGFLTMLVEAGKQVWVDTHGPALEAALAYPDICIKVNGDELGEVLGFEVQDLAAARRAIMVLAERGTATGVITLGAAGAVLATTEGCWHAQPPPVGVVSSVGSGDSFLGGLVSALDSGKDWRAALCDAAAAGTANALSAGGARFTLQEFEAIREQVTIQGC